MAHFTFEKTWAFPKQHKSLKNYINAFDLPSGNVLASLEQKQYKEEEWKK